MNIGDALAEMRKGKLLVCVNDPIIAWTIQKNHVVRIVLRDHSTSSTCRFKKGQILPAAKKQSKFRDGKFITSYLLFSIAESSFLSNDWRVLKGGE